MKRQIHVLAGEPIELGYRVIVTAKMLSEGGAEAAALHVAVVSLNVRSFSHSRRSTAEREYRHPTLKGHPLS